MNQGEDEKGKKEEAKKNLSFLDVEKKIRSTTLQNYGSRLLRRSL